MTSPKPDFVDLSETCPGIQVALGYFTTDNFTGKIVPGYLANRALMARGPAEALARVQASALKQGLTLKILDCYRPVKAVAFFLEWATLPESSPELKKIFYPTYTRKEILEKGFIAQRSSHSKGSAVDLTLVDLKSGAELDMGGRFDFFDEVSHTESEKITLDQRKNRMKLKELMEKGGFRNFRMEWWHYSFRPEPYPDQYFDFDVE